LGIAGRLIRIVRRLPEVPRHARIWWEFTGAWSENRWPDVRDLMLSLRQSDLAGDDSRIYLAMAYSHLGQHADAVREFAAVTPPVGGWREQVVYCNRYAYSLCQLGLVDEAVEHVRSNFKPTWPAKFRTWSEQLIERGDSGEEPANPPGGRRLLH
jgi:hypothetical protein